MREIVRLDIPARLMLKSTKIPTRLGIFVYGSIMRHWQFLLLFGLIACLDSACRAADTQPPTIAISMPGNGALVSKTLAVSVSATDKVGVASVTLKLDGTDTGKTLTNAPFSFSLSTGELRNGMHTLMAVATDAAGNFARSAVVSISVTNPPAYSLADGPFVVENLGSVLSANTMDRPFYFTLSNNVHFAAFYLTTYGTTNFQILDVNLSQGTARLTNGASLGRIGVHGTVLYPNGNVYIASMEANGLGYFSEYNPTTGETRQIAQATGSDPGQYDEIGDDGWIYIGGYPNAFVDRYNPNTDVYERLNTGSALSSYAYTLGADTRYVYVGVGESPWYMAIYDTQTTNTVLYWSTNADVFGQVRHATNGCWYYERFGPTTTNQVTWYQLTNGAPLLTAYNANTPPPGLLVINAQRANVVDGVNNGYLMGYNVNLDYAYPDSASNYANIQWRAVGTSNWLSVVVTNFHLTPIGISRLYPLDSNRLLGFSSFYGPVWTYSISNSQTTDLGVSPSCNLYDAIVGTGVDYFCGYVATLLHYDPSRPWTLVASTTNFFNTSINPYQTSLAIGKHEYFTTYGSDGMVYVAAIHERDSAGGELGWYDPVTGTNGSLRTPFLTDEPADLKPALGGTKLLYVSTSTNIFVFDVATKSIDRIISPLGTNLTVCKVSGAYYYGLDKVVEISPGIVLGVAGSNIFKVNITNGSVINSSTLPGYAFQESQRIQNRRLVMGPDGYIWMFRWYRDAQNFNKSSLYRISPADLSYSTVLTNTFYSYGENNLMFNGGDMYLYGGNNLYRVRGVLNPLLLPPPTGLRVNEPGE